MKNFLKNKKILIIEDDEINTYLLRVYLKGAYTVRTKNGREALKVLEKDSFDAIILDLLTPIMDGFKFLERIKEIPIDTPIIITSALDPLTCEEIKPQIKSYLQKPITKEILLDEIKKL